MENQMFRQESIDQVNSAEQIKDYLKVTSPRLWMVITAVLVLLAGFLVYASMAQEEISIPVKIAVYHSQDDDGKMILAGFQIPAGESGVYKTGMPVRFAGVTGTIWYFIETEDGTEAVVWPDNPRADIAEGEYDATVIVETSTPLSELIR